MRIAKLTYSPRVLNTTRGFLKFFSIILLPVFISFMPAASVFAQADIRITGRIVREDGLPVAKTSVIVKGSSAGVTSDDNGNYAITAPSNGILVFSYVGFTSAEIHINNRTTIDVGLSAVPNSLS